MSLQTIEITKKDKVAVIKLNRPELLNAVNEQLVWDFQKATEDVKKDDSVRVVIITGSGRGFSAGADLSEKKASWKGSKDALLRGYKPFFENIINMPKPVIASISGPAAGIGAAIAMSCDLRVMSDDSYILSVFSNIALVPDGGLSWYLPKFMGFAKAYEYAIEAKKISAEECLKYGIANKVVAKDELENITLEWAIKLSKRSSQSLNHTKRLMRESLHIGYWDTFHNEAEIQNELTVSPQNREAVKAFLEKREPNFD
ncbi:MAG: enoyl-CoA hydratase/isomerase family protein [Gammaproteobacteria bacterium]|jgi:2-(1,2-epoxy-1,2-dihydrophenyl)acetyl-CoA isomerase|tara:strand:- start:444 stop:1217 length:774 start_codon:yes stop_codon:yes gene_type:complete